MATIFDVEKYEPKFGDVFFFDNNVWISLFYPQANVNRHKQMIYSQLLSSIKTRNCAIFINSLVLSEFSNYWLQTDFKLYKQREQNHALEYKRDFIGTEYFKESIMKLKETINRIIQVSERASDNFNAIYLTNVYSEFGNCDFNDVIIPD
jgi:hypothetical protein